MAAWLTYDYDNVPALDKWDRVLLQRATTTYYESDQPTGEGTISAEQRTMLRERGVL